MVPPAASRHGRKWDFENGYGLCLQSVLAVPAVLAVLAVPAERKQEKEMYALTAR